jgi:hypothetical protein
MSERDFTQWKKGLVLSANDVMATVLLLYEDEGYAPLNIATVDLPFGGLEYREKSSNGKSKFQRGDLITIKCEVTEQKKRFFDEEAIKDFLQMKVDDADSDKMDAIFKSFEQEENFAKFWADLEYRDFAKRTATSVQCNKEPEK